MLPKVAHVKLSVSVVVTSEINVSRSGRQLRVACHDSYIQVSVHGECHIIILVMRKKTLLKRGYQVVAAGNESLQRTHFQTILL